MKCPLPEQAYGSPVTRVLSVRGTVAGEIEWGDLLTGLLLSLILKILTILINISLLVIIPNLL